MPAKLEKAEAPLQASLSFMVPMRSDSQEIISKIKRVPGVKQVELSFAADVRQGMQELKEEIQQEVERAKRDALQKSGKR